MNEISLMIDGRHVSGKKGMTILEAAKNVGIFIPTLCHDERLSLSGNCRICVVEVEGSRNLVGSCHTPIAEGMVVHTNTPKIIDTRKTIIELIIASHIGDCVTDSEARACTLHNLASELEVGPPRFRVRKLPLYPQEKGRYVLRDMSRCILCRRCIRACKEIAGHNLYSLSYRALESKVTVDFDVPLDKDVCKDCGICIDYCPTNALMWPEGVKKRDGNSNHKRDVVAISALDNENHPELLDLLKYRQLIEGYISEKAMVEIAKSLDISPGNVYSVATFYAFLSTKPKGRHMIRICKSTPCYIKNGSMVVEWVRRAIGINIGETTPDGLFSFELTNCIGACDRAPAMLIDDSLYGNLTPSKITEILKSYRDL